MNVDGLRRWRRRSGARALGALLFWLSAAGLTTAQEPVAQPALVPDEPAPAAPPGPVLASVVSRLMATNLTRTDERNEANPRFSGDGRYLSYESRDGSAQTIHVTEPRNPGRPLQRITSFPEQTPLSAEDALLGLAARDESFNTQITFVPSSPDFIFTGNAGTGIYQLYRGSVAGGQPSAITERSKEDGHPAVSPDGLWLVYVSAREGIGKLYLRDLTTGEERQLTHGRHVDLYPVWSPDSKSVAYTSGDNDNHDAYVILDVFAPQPQPVPLTSWNFDDLRPTFSADGRLIAFYSNFSPTGEDKEWSILVVPADGSGPRKGAALARQVVALNVVKDPAMGPAWLPWGDALVYARNLKKQWNPIYVVNAKTREERRIETNTRMNHDLTCSADGRVAFRAQVASWDDIFLAPLVRMP